MKQKLVYLITNCFNCKYSCRRLRTKVRRYNYEYTGGRKKEIIIDFMILKGKITFMSNQDKTFYNLDSKNLFLKKTQKLS